MMFLLMVTLTSMLLAAVMSVIAWRLAGDERRRSDARVAALALEIHEPATAAAGRANPPWAHDLELRSNAPIQEAPMFDGPFVPRPNPSGSRMLAILGGGVAVFAAGVAIVIGASGGWTRAPRSVRAVTAAAPAMLPLELVALGHERVGDQLTIRGVVRNPSTGAGVGRLTAVVSLFTPDGGFLTSGRAGVEAPALQPGSESTFVITVPGALDVGRYRVSFRSDDHVVPHLDRRHEG